MLESVQQKTGINDFEPYQKWQFWRPNPANKGWMYHMMTSPQGILGILTNILYFGRRNFKSFSQVSIVDANISWLRKTHT